METNTKVRKVGLSRQDMRKVLEKCGYDPDTTIVEDHHGHMLALKIPRDDYFRLAEMASWLWNAGQVKVLPLYELWDFTVTNVIGYGPDEYDVIVFPDFELVDHEQAVDYWSYY